MNQQCGVRTGRTQTKLYKHRRSIEAGNVRLRKKRNYTVLVTKTKALIGFASTAKLIGVCVLAYAKCWFSPDALIIDSA